MPDDPKIQEALRIVLPWLGRPCEGDLTKHFCHICAQRAGGILPWRFETCPHQSPIPMPPCTDDLLAAILRRLAEEGISIDVTKRPDEDFDCLLGRDDNRWNADAIDPVHAALFAAAAYLRHKEETK
jgi:hypothetical protein